MAANVLSANIRSLRAALGLNQTQFAERLNTSQPNITKWERGVTPGGEHLAMLAEMAQTTAGDFLSRPWEPKAQQTDHPPILSADAGDTVEIIQLDLSLSMGPGTMIEDFVESEAVSFDASMLKRITRTPSDRLRFVTGIGTSHEPKFQHNDQFLIDINERRLTRIDGYYWITFEGAHALKRLRPVSGGRIQIVSDNPEFAPMEVGMDEVRIEGRAVWFARGL